MEKKIQWGSPLSLLTVDSCVWVRHEHQSMWWEDGWWCRAAMNPKEKKERERKNEVNHKKSGQSYTFPYQFRIHWSEITHTRKKSYCPRGAAPSPLPGHVGPWMWIQLVGVPCFYYQRKTFACSQWLLSPTNSELHTFQNLLLLKKSTDPVSGVTNALNMKKH